MLTIELGTNEMKDDYDSVVTYITLSCFVPSKALSGISLIWFPSRNLKKIGLTLVLYIQPVNKYNI